MTKENKHRFGKHGTAYNAEAKAHAHSFKNHPNVTIGGHYCVVCGWRITAEFLDYALKNGAEIAK